MKKIICLVLIFTMMLTACSKWKVEIVDPTKPVEGDSKLTVSEEKEQPEHKEESKSEPETEPQPENPPSEEKIPEETEELTEKDEPSVSILLI